MENKKGRYVVSRYMRGITSEYDYSLSGLNTARREAINSPLNKGEKTEALEMLDDAIKKLREKRDIVINNELRKIISNIKQKQFELQISQNIGADGKAIYSIDDSAESFFTIKFLQYCLRRLYKVKQSSRAEIIGQLAQVLDDGFPKHIYRVDIKSFYESIPVNIYDKVMNENLLSESNKEILGQVKEAYLKKYNHEKGVPRGIGVSAYLSELYMRDFDEKAKKLQDLIFYRRYVDDMIFVFTPSTPKSLSSYGMKIDKMIQSFGLNKNEDKTKPHGWKSITDKNVSYRFDFLGYNFNFEDDELSIGLTENRYDRVVRRIDVAIDEYLKLKNKKDFSAIKLLYGRLNLLTGNTRLFNRKNSVLIGIYFSNPYLTRFEQLICLDLKLRERLATLDLSDAQRKRFNKLSFFRGFKEKKYIPFKNHEDFKYISSCWKHDRNLAIK